MQHSICTLNHVIRIFYFYSNFMGLCSQVKLSDYIGKKYVVLFFYPLDFTFVCPTGKLTLRTIKLIVYSTMYFKIYNSRICIYPPCLPVVFCVEITAFSDRHAEFEKLNTEILGVSIDSVVGAFPVYSIFKIV